LESQNALKPLYLKGLTLVSGLVSYAQARRARPPSVVAAAGIADLVVTKASLQPAPLQTSITHLPDPAGP